MTGGGGLIFIAFLTFVITPSLYAKPKECQKSPLWALEHNPLKKSEGNVTLLALIKSTSLVSQELALRMEGLLQDLHDYGMYDLSFIIINSKEFQHDDMVDRIRARLSFPLYQEQTEEQIWNIIDGDTNDIFVYDRCGRLTYFIPFPLSVTHDKQPIVRAAILSTYFRSPCGLFCSTNESFAQTNENSKKESTEVPINDNDPNLVRHPNGTGVIVDIEDDFFQFENETANENITLDEYDGNDITNFNTTENTNSSMENIMLEDDYKTDDSNVTIKEVTPTQKSLLSSFISFIWGDGKQKENINQTTPNELTNKNSTHIMHTVSVINESESNFNTTESNSEMLPTKTETCAGVDENVCKDWSKTKLLHAQRCCVIATQRYGNRHGTGCKNLGRKRCKKIQPVLKCCLKTELTATTNEQHQSM